MGAPVLSRAYGPAPVEGRVVQVESFAESTRILLDGVALRRIAAEDTPHRVRLRLNGDAPPLGARISVLAKVMPPSGPALPGGYDFRRRAWFDGIGGVGFAMGSPRILAEPPGEAGLVLAIAELRQDVGARVLAAVPGPEGAVAAALIIGDRSAIPLDVIDAMRDSGLAHLLAISGLHMGLVAACLFFGLRSLLALFEPLALRHPIKKYAAAVALIGSAGYLVLAGATVPTQRAFLMTGFVLLAAFFDRTAISLRLVAWAAAVILILAPESLLGPSFQMSFAAVIALVAVYDQGWRPLRGRFGGGWRARILLYIGGVLATTLIASVATGLFALYHFGRIAHFGLAANLLAVPLTALWIMPWAVASMLLMPFGVESWALAPMGWGIELVVDIARTVGGWPGAISRVPAMPGWGLAAIALGGLWLCLWRRGWRWFGLAGIAVGLASIPLNPLPDILVSEDAALMGIRTETGELALTDYRREARVAEQWLEQLGLTATIRDGMACDPLSCVATVKGMTVALVQDGAALAEDCRLAEIVVSAVPVRRRCPSAHIVVDRFNVWRRGAHAIRIGGDGAIMVETVAGAAGDRPWSPAHRRTSGQ